MIYPANIGEYLSIDEVSLSNGELYTFVTNKAGRRKKSSLVASIKGIRFQDIMDTLERLPLEARNNVREITLDMAKNIESAVRMVFSEASLVTDRFHVVRLVMEAVQHLRIKKRWEALDKENELILKYKSEGKRYKFKKFSNGDTPKQLLARSRYIIAKKEVQWTDNQRERAEMRFKEWINLTLEKELEPFYTTANTVKTNFDTILNFYTNRSTNAPAESFNAKIELFRANLRGVIDTTFLCLG